MRNVNDPRHNGLFDPFASVLSPRAYRRILKGWQGTFRHVILKLMPVDVIAARPPRRINFSPDMGAPTKELYSMAGLVLIKEFKDWTTTEAAEAYMFSADVQYALNLEPAQQELSERTIDRYEQIFVENDLASTVMHDVTVTLAKELELDVSRQRVDSTRVLKRHGSFRSHAPDGSGHQAVPDATETAQPPGVAGAAPGASGAP